MNMIKKLLAILMAFTISGMTIAAGKDTRELEEMLKKTLPEGTFYTIDETVIQGIFQVNFSNTFIYLSADGKHAFKGDIINISSNENLTENKRSANRLKTLASVTDADMITYAAGKTKNTLTVFTDIDCGYCRKLHAEMPEYNKRGIEIRYVFLPRAGIGSGSYDKAVSVWCAKDRRKALDAAKANIKVERKECENPVLKHMRVAEMLGVSSTPTMFLEDGTVLPGYIPAPQLEGILAQHKQLANRR